MEGADQSFRWSFPVDAVAQLPLLLGMRGACRAGRTDCWPGAGPGASSSRSFIYRAALFGEGGRPSSWWGRACVADQVGDAVGESSRLAAAAPGTTSKGPLGDRTAPALGLIGPPMESHPESEGV